MAVELELDELRATVRNMAAALQDLRDREAIRDCVARFAQGIDRVDEDVLRSVFWSNAIDDHFFTSGNAYEFIEWVIVSLRMMTQTMHLVGQSLIRIDGDSADAETYTFAYHRLNAVDFERDRARSESYFDLALGARYIDKFERRSGEWRIVDRHVLYDWFRIFNDSFDPKDGFMGRTNVRTGGRKPDDALYTRFSKPPRMPI